MIQLAKWDTENLGLKVGNLILDGTFTQSVLDKELRIAKCEGYDLLYLKGETLPEDILDDNILLADQKVIYKTIINEQIEFEDPNIVSYLGKNLDSHILSIALQSGGYSRYYQDKNIPIYVFLTLYKIWIIKSLDGTIATDVLAYEEKGNILGLLTYWKSDDKVTIGLVAVDKASSGKGIGSKLMKSFLSKFPNGTIIEVATQIKNRVACMYYEKNGFMAESVTNIYHLWPKLID